MGARNRVGIWLSYRPARLHRLAELIPWNRFLGSLKLKNIRSVSIYGKFLSFYPRDFFVTHFFFSKVNLFLQRKNSLFRWKSYFEPEKTILMTNVQDSVFQLFQRVENKVFQNLCKRTLTE
jgi:hypothetical protein